MTSNTDVYLMARETDKRPGVLRSLDWWTIGIYLALLIFGWLSVCGASYTYGDTDIFSLDTRSGMQIVWIGTSICLGFVLLMLDDRFYDTFSYIIYAVLLLLLFQRKLAGVIPETVIPGKKGDLVVVYIKCMGAYRVQEMAVVGYDKYSVLKF